MVQKIEDLKDDSQSGAFPAGKHGALQTTQVSIEITLSTKAIASLRERDGRPITETCRARQVAAIERGYAIGLYEARVVIRDSCSVGLNTHLRRLAGVRRYRERGTFAT